MRRVAITLFRLLVPCGLLAAGATSANAQDCAAVLQTAWGLVAIFPPDNPWNQQVADLPVHPESARWIAAIGAAEPLHPDFGTEWEGQPIGIPFAVARPGTPHAEVTFDYPDESDPGPYPVPPNPPIEAGRDRHLLVIDPAGDRLYEIYDLRSEDGGWRAGSGAIFDLASNALRPLYWTSADGAGLPIFPGLVRYDEAIERGVICHALRFTAPATQRGFIAPARHFASDDSDPGLPPMGLRLRLRADFPLDDLPHPAVVVLTALKRYGMLLADNGSPWFVSGAPDPRWDDEALAAIALVQGSDLEAVWTGPTITE